MSIVMNLALRVDTTLCRGTWQLCYRRWEHSRLLEVAANGEATNGRVFVDEYAGVRRCYRRSVVIEGAVTIRSITYIFTLFVSMNCRYWLVCYFRLSSWLIYDYRSLLLNTGIQLFIFICVLNGQEIIDAPG
jgi:hypothetical protein